MYRPSALCFSQPLQTAILWQWVIPRFHRCWWSGCKIAGLLASAEFQHSHLRSGVLLLVLLMMPNRYLSAAASRPLAHINRELLRQQFDEWVKASSETPVVVNASATTEQAAAAGTQLGRYTQNVTEAARQGQLDPVLCRDREIDVMIDILSRRRKNNPMVVEEAGVGKSALIEGLALRIVAGLVPERLRDVELLMLDLGAMQAGASVKGEFEKRFKGVIHEVKDSPRPIILFIDEAHTLIGAGNQAGGLDVSNLLKPALARGELRTIAATTWSEYKKYVEKDAALLRRFQRVNVGELSVDESAVILRGLRAIYEKAHGVLIDEDALHAAAHLSARYISGRQLPDKAIDVLDTACARVAINLTTPPVLSASYRRACISRRWKSHNWNASGVLGWVIPLNDWRHCAPSVKPVSLNWRSGRLTGNSRSITYSALSLCAVHCWPMSFPMLSNLTLNHRMISR